MTIESPGLLLTGKKALVIGIVNEHSIADGCAKAFHTLGAEVTVTYLNEKAKPYVEPPARELAAPLIVPLDVSEPGQLEDLFAAVTAQWGRLDAISPGPVKTRAASGLKDSDTLLDETAPRAPLGTLVDIMDVGYTCAFLASPQARHLTGSTMYVDGGLHIMG